MLGCWAATSIPVPLSSYDSPFANLIGVFALVPALTPQASIHRFHPPAYSSLSILLPVPYTLLRPTTHPHTVAVCCGYDDAVTTETTSCQLRNLAALLLRLPSYPIQPPTSAYQWLSATPCRRWKSHQLLGTRGLANMSLPLSEMDLSSASWNFDLLEARNRLSKRLSLSFSLCSRVDVDHWMRRTQKSVNSIERVEYQRWHRWF